MALEIPEQEEEDLLSRLVTVAEDLEPYVLQWPAPDDADGFAEALALVVAKRRGGMLLALPPGLIPDQILELANAGEDAGPVGASTRITIPGVILDGGLVSPTGTDVTVVLVDLAEELVPRL